MLSRAFRANLRSNATFSRAALVKRSVTTDAASAHADRDAVPSVSWMEMNWEMGTCGIEGGRGLGDEDEDEDDG